jgi:hypothetical protein
MLVRFLEIDAIKRTGQGNFAFRAATDAADVALNGRACTARATFTADLAKNLNRHQLTVLSDQPTMQRVDLYIKVELELDENEKPERVAGEICRQLEKLYMVRHAELSNVVARD